MDEKERTTDDMIFNFFELHRRMSIGEISDEEVQVLWEKQFNSRTD